jgi:hypothetical protein
MVCPKCQANVAGDSNFCPRCGTPFKKRQGFVATLWRDNKPGFIVLSLLLIAMLASIVYYLNSKTGTFEVTVETVTDEEALEIVAAATVNEYCQQFRADCQNRSDRELKAAIKKVIPQLVNPLKTGQGYARIIYRNGTGKPIDVTEFKYRRPPGPWTTGNSQTVYGPRIQVLQTAIRVASDRASFQDKVELALTTAVTKNHGSFTLGPNEKKIWRLSNVNQEAEFQVEFSQNGTRFSTPILRLR